ncbi:hypothetical protein [Arthrobacter sp. ISL-5]|uniref:hypothetical protein n=1 Tax=Arthrobacter sp. ISL-5 TaxID=2819111 RepID=UPI001BEB939E|nr:hypothetical protein [Arthrobacter sp. ISL-5]MBT2554420.1 hypothetical protein [Arthrobacter sp. ISL-5]
MNAPTIRPLRRVLGRGEPVWWAMFIGGLLWIVHGYYRNLTPHGPDVLWQEDRQYSPVLSAELFVLYNLPGVLALLLTAWAALSYLAFVPAAHSRLRRTARVLVALSLVLAIIAAAGQLIQFDPLTTGGLSLGAPVVGLALFLSGVAATGDGHDRNGNPKLLGLGLMLLGAVGMFVLPLRPLMYALELLPLAFGAAIFALFGTGWIILGFSLRNAAARDTGTACA